MNRPSRSILIRRWLVLLAFLLAIVAASLVNLVDLRNGLGDLQRYRSDPTCRAAAQSHGAASQGACSWVDARIDGASQGGKVSRSYYLDLTYPTGETASAELTGQSDLWDAIQRGGGRPARVRLFDGDAIEIDTPVGNSATTKRPDLRVSSDQWWLWVGPVCLVVWIFFVMVGIRGKQL